MVTLLVLVTVVLLVCLVEIVLFDPGPVLLILAADVLLLLGGCELLPGADGLLLLEADDGCELLLVVTPWGAPELKPPKPPTPPLPPTLPLLLWGLLAVVATDGPPPLPGVLLTGGGVKLL
jgi:hypothetical protein